MITNSLNSRLLARNYWIGPSSNTSIKGRNQKLISRHCEIADVIRMKIVTVDHGDRAPSKIHSTFQPSVKQRDVDDIIVFERFQGGHGPVSCRTGLF